MFLDQHTRTLLDLALAEDIGRGDWTTLALIPENRVATADIVVKQAVRIAGLLLVEAVFQALDPAVLVEPLVPEGTDALPMMPVCRLHGSARSILIGERTALNFLARLTGIASHTREAVQRLHGSRAKLLDTRKTTPGWRQLEKYAVRMGGGRNHRFGLDDMILIKDNHIALAGSVTAALRLARETAPPALKIEVEVETLTQLEEALASDADVILLDNMDLATMREAVVLTAGRVPLEASGNMTIDRLQQVAQTGVDFISMGALTHGATSCDVSLDVQIAADSARLHVR